jgi:hypothetical protein
VSGRIVGQREEWLTEEKLVLVNYICNPKVGCPEEYDERLDDTIEKRDHKNEDCLWIDSAIIDHRRRV